FFFSSRRRHTRFSRDWSSDVCSSDLYTSATFTGNKSYNVPGLTQGKLDSSLVLAYYIPENSIAWYPVGGAGHNALYSTRYYLLPTTFYVNVLTPDHKKLYPLPVTFLKFRVIVAHASSIIN